MGDTQRTIVVRVTKANSAMLLADPRFVWVGRASGRLGMKASDYGNPFKEGMDPFEAMRLLVALRPLNGMRAFVVEFDGRLTAEKAVECYGHWITTGIRSGVPLRPSPEELRSKLLGCACCDWNGVGEPTKPCHAVTLARIVDALEPSEAPNA